MKTDRVLGVLWFALCGHASVSLLLPLSHIFISPKLRPTPELGLGLLLSGIFLTGAVASIFLFRGARWARRYVGWIAILTVVFHITQMMAGATFSAVGLAFTLFALVSVVLLLLPRHEPVA